MLAWWNLLKKIRKLGVADRVKALRASLLYMFIGVLFAAPAHTETIIPVTYAENDTNSPVLDGNLDDWLESDFIEIAVSNNRPDSRIEIAHVELAMKAFGSFVFVALKWSDRTYDRQHKPYIWDGQKQRYATGPQREDRIVLQFEMNGRYDVNWLSGSEFKADTWHWKSARTAPIGLAHDAMTIISTSPRLRAFKVAGASGEDIYIQRKSDRGDKIYVSKRYGLKEKALMQKYLPNPGVQGSVADVKSASRWRNGTWTVELKRLLDTENDDDARFKRGQDIRGGLAVFDRSGEDDHAISDNLIFRFE
jgi:hypothetical protein